MAQLKYKIVNGHGSQWNGQATTGRDSYSTTIKILDENDNVLQRLHLTETMMWQL